MSTWQWVSLIIVIAGTGVWNVQQMWSLDNRWQERSAKMQADIRNDIIRVEGKIPPDWVMRMVEQNERDISRLREKFEELTKNNIKVIDKP